MQNIEQHRADLLRAVNQALSDSGSKFQAADLSEAKQLLVNVGIAEVERDMSAGFVPRDVPDFSTLHDYRDANYYGLAFEIVDIYGLEDTERRSVLWELSESVQNRINDWLKRTLPERAASAAKGAAR